MARTPLLRSLRKLYIDYRLAKRHEIPLEAVRELRASRGITRRQLLAGTAAGAGMLALPRIARSGRDDPKIVIVGAGIAGLTCAVRLADRGIAATVYEASCRAGGRMFSNTSTWADNQVTEWCGELIDTGHNYIRELAHRFNLPARRSHRRPATSDRGHILLSAPFLPEGAGRRRFCARVRGG